MRRMMSMICEIPGMPQLSSRPAVRRDVFSTAAGPIEIAYPCDLEAEDVRDFEEWVALVVRKLKRQARGDNCATGLPVRQAANP